MSKEDIESQIDRNKAKRVALAAGVFIGLVAVAVGHKQIIAQIRRATIELPNFYEGIRTNAQSASLRILETESPELAEEMFSKLKDKRGSERLQVSIGSIAFLTPPERILRQAVAARAIVPGTYAVLSEEVDPEKRDIFYALRLTNRNLGPRPKRL